MRLIRLIIAPLAVLALSFPAAASAAPPDHWVATWSTAPMQFPNKDEVLAVDTSTYRQIVRVSIGGTGLRVVFTNQHGLDPLTITAASVALPTSNKSSTIQPDTAHPLTFSGHPGITVPPGAIVVSDPVALPITALADLAITTVLPAQKMRMLTEHSFANSSNFQAVGNQLAATTLDTPKEINSWFFLKSVDVTAPAASAAIVTFGDSITDGAHSARNAHADWPDMLAKRLQASKETNLAVLNTGIGGNRILHDGTGPSALARFDTDVIAQAGVRYVIVLEGINDIGHAADPNRPYDIVSADDLITGLSQLARRAHTHGIKIFGATLTPYLPAGYSSPAGEAIRSAVNQWIRTTKELDGFIDFDLATRDPANPGSFISTADSGDHLHPSDAGYKAMSDAIDLKLFH